MKSEEKGPGRPAPRARPGPGRNPAATRERGRSRLRQKVLIADPDPDVLESTAILVANLGYEPVAVDQPSDLLEIIEAAQPGLVLVETQFPGLNLAGLVASLRAFPTTADIRVAFFSASKDLSATAQRHQVWGTLAKPFALRELAQLLVSGLGPSPVMLEAGRERDIEREVRDSFREYRNIITALDNYIALLDRAAELSRPSKLAVQRLGDLALKLEAKTEHMRAFVLGLMLPEPGESAPGPPTRHRSERAPRRAATATARTPRPDSAP